MPCPDHCFSQLCQMFVGAGTVVGSLPFHVFSAKSLEYLTVNLEYTARLYCGGKLVDIPSMVCYLWLFEWRML